MPMNDVSKMASFLEDLGILNNSDGAFSLKEELPPLLVEWEETDYMIEWIDVPGADSGEKLVHVFGFLNGEESEKPEWLKAA